MPFNKWSQHHTTPQANRNVENLNGSLVQLLTKLSQEHPNTTWTEHLPITLLILSARINCGTDFSPSALAFGTPDGLKEVEQGKLWTTVPNQPPLVTTPFLSQWCAKSQDIEHKQIEGDKKHLEVRYTVGDPIYALNPNLTKLEPNYLGPFKIATVYDNHTYKLEDSQENTKTLHHNRLHPCCAIPTQRLFMWAFPDLPQVLILVHDNKQGARGGVETKILLLPANVLHNTQGALNEGSCGKFNSLVIYSLVLNTLLSTRESSAAYVNLLVFLV
ncbi:hypothetical protein DSO57_1012374 [Entomophthora muscae]|uniref:Uncharacterized protein n=1 Tax=Entomophthora muscae TaxID=34485 RepID=A0ACC2TGW0_9FUNG|nr:hypothetical protein DSO57_1012374 [Entomophthora muscae]